MSMATKPNRKRTSLRRRAGMSILYLIGGMSVFIGFTSFAVDYGRVQMAKTELRRAADAAARAGASALGSYGTAQNLAVQYAGLNTCNGSSVVISPSQTANQI